MKKKLSILTYSLASGGAERVISILLPELQKKYDVTLFLMNDTIFYDIPKDTKIVYLENSNPSENGVLKLLKLPFLAWRYKKMNDSDISISFTNRPNYINALSKVLGMSGLVILNERSTPSEVYSKLSLSSYINILLIKYLYQLADGVTVNSKGGGLDLKDNFKVDTSLFYNPLNFVLIEKLSNENVPIVKDNFTFVTLGSINSIKNHKLIIDSMRKVNASLWIIGDGELKNYLLNYIGGLNLSEKVKILGRQKNPFSYMREADAFILSSNFEGFPNVIIEALACGLPVISTDCKNGPREILAPHSRKKFQLKEGVELAKYGILVPVKDQIQLEYAMQLIISNKEKYFEYSSKAKERAKYFDVKHLSLEYLRFLDMSYERKIMKKNIDLKTVQDFGNEWSKFNQMNLDVDEHNQIFNDYFKIFPFCRLPKNSIGADIGCGSGRWAKLVASKVGRLYCVDASHDALSVAKKNLSKYDNIEFFNESVDSLSMEDNSLDFIYSLGVLHHIPDTQEGINACVKKIKENGFFLVYLYYNLDNKPVYFRLIWRLSNIARVIISKMPNIIKLTICELIAFFIYWPFAKISFFLEKIGIRSSNIPLSYYKNKSFYTMRTDALDRFGTRLEKRFSRKQIEVMMRNAGLDEIIFSDNEPYWVAVGKKCAE